MDKLEISIKKEENPKSHIVMGYIDGEMIASGVVYKEGDIEPMVSIVQNTGRMSMAQTTAHVETIRRVLAEMHTMPPLVNDRTKSL